MNSETRNDPAEFLKAFEEVEHSRIRNRPRPLDELLRVAGRSVRTGDEDSVSVVKKFQQPASRGASTSTFNHE